MATYSNALIVYNAGKLQKVASTDTLTFGGSLNLGGDLVVEGSIISTNTSNVVIKDAFLDLRAGYSMAAGTSGFTFNVAASGAQAFANQLTPSIGMAAATVSFSGPHNFAVGDIIQISGAKVGGNNGLFSVVEVSFTSVGLLGTTVSIPSYAKFLQSDLEEAETPAPLECSVTKVDLAVFGVSDGSLLDKSFNYVAAGRMVTAYFQGAQLHNFEGVANANWVAGDGYNVVFTSENAPTLQSAYDSGSTIQLTGGKSLTTTAPGSLSAMSMDVAASNQIRVTTIGDHHLVNGAQVVITGANHMMGASPNGVWTAVNVTHNTFELLNSNGSNFVYAGGASIRTFAAVNLAANSDSALTTSDASVSVSAQAAVGFTYATGSLVDVMSPMQTPLITFQGGTPGIGCNGVAFNIIPAGGNSFLSRSLKTITLNINMASGLAATDLQNALNAGLMVNNVSSSITGFANVTVATPHLLQNGDFVEIVGATCTGGTINGRFAVGIIDEHTFQLYGSSWPVTASWMGGGFVKNLTTDAYLRVQAIPSPFTITMANAQQVVLSGGRGAGSASLKRGVVELDPIAVGGIQGQGAGLILDSVEGLSGAAYKASLYGSESVLVKAAGTEGINLLANPSVTAGSIHLSATNSLPPGSKAGSITAEAATSLVLFTTEASGTASISSGSVSILGTSGIVVAGGTGSIILGAAQTITLENNAGRIKIFQPADPFIGPSINIGSNSDISGAPATPIMLGSASTNNGAVGTWLHAVNGDNVSRGMVLRLGTYYSMALGLVLPKVVPADADDATLVVREIVGIAMDSGPSAPGAEGDVRVATVPGSVVSVAYMVPPTDADIGKPVYLDTTPGFVTLTPPIEGRVYRVGIVYSQMASAPGLYPIIFLPAFVADLS